MCYVVGLSSPSKVKKFLFFFLSRRGGRGRVFAVFFAPFPEKGILDFIAHRPIIQLFKFLRYAIGICARNSDEEVITESSEDLLS